MANTEAARPMSSDEKRVIFASSLGTIFEWYDFYLFGVLTSIIGVPFFLYLIMRERRALGGGVA